MANPTISKLAFGFALLGAIFSSGFLSPQLPELPIKSEAMIVQPSNYTTIAKAPVAKPLTINQKHVFEGEINRKGLAVGYHHRPNGKDAANARMVKLTGMPNTQGVYTGRVEIRNLNTGKWVSKLSSSSFFPERWSQTQVLTDFPIAGLRPKF